MLGGVPFSALQAITQPMQPTHLSRSTVKPQRAIVPPTKCLLVLSQQMECHTACTWSLHSTCKGVTQDACAVALGASLRETQDIRPSSAAGCSARGGN